MGQWHNRTVTSGFPHYISSSKVWVRVEGVKTTSRSFDQYADYLNLKVTSTAAPAAIVTQTIYIYNYQEGSWTRLSTAIVSSTDRTIGPLTPPDSQLYVDAATGEVKVKVISTSTARFRAYIDYLHLEVEYEDTSKITLELLNTSPETIHLTALYIEGESGGFTRLTEPTFSIWLAPGETVKEVAAYTWLHDTYLIKTVSERGSVFAAVASPT